LAIQKKSNLWVLLLVIRWGTRMPERTIRVRGNGLIIHDTTCPTPHLIFDGLPSLDQMMLVDTTTFAWIMIGNAHDPQQSNCLVS
jgi:hypothetical protein